MKYAYVGCRTTKERNARGKGIKVYKIEANGNWKEIQIVSNLVNPSFLCMDHARKYLYAIHGDFSEISSFMVNQDNGRLIYMNTVSTEGVNPVHLSIDKTNKWIFVANLQSGSVVVIPRKEDGSLGEHKELYKIEGNNADAISHPHQVMQDKTGEYLVVSCQGRKAGFGQVDVFRIDSEAGTLEKTDVVRSREIAEPRHVVFHPNNKFCYGVNEKDYSVTFYKFDAQNGGLVPCQILPTLPSTYTGDGWASGIVVDNDGKYIVVSNRKHDSITCFEIDPQTGMLTYKDCIKTGGGQPRYIVVEDDTNIVWAANETTDTITGFEINQDTGKLTPNGTKIHTESPVCVIFN